ncbi:MAG: FliM/FliN family flagellar motor switch protein, partial [Oscillospiraceae bacterium]
FSKEENKVKEYDFRSPKKFTKERLRSIESMHEALARSLTTYFTSTLRVYCEAEVIEIEEQRYFEYSNALPDIVLMGMIDITPVSSNYGEFNVSMDMTASLGYFMIDRLLGGSGNTNDLTRDFTDIEKEILTQVFTKMTKSLQETWCNYVECKAALKGIETNSRLLQSAMQEDIVVIVVVALKMKNLMGNINICIPAANLEEMSDIFSSKYQKAQRKYDIVREQMRRQILMSAIYDGKLDMVAELDNFEMGAYDITHLQEGDIITLNKRIDQDIRVYVGGIPWFDAKLGRTKLKKAVMIDKFL